MGVAFVFLEFFDICHKLGTFRDPMMALGSLTINDSEENIQAYLTEHPDWDTKDGVSVRSLMKQRYGINVYSDCDLDGKADLAVDLNKPLPSDLFGTANTILNGGTLEHVLNASQAFENCHGMLGVGGTIVHMAPITWYNHGFYNLNPVMFRMVARANSYTLVAEAFWFSRRLPPMIEAACPRISPKHMVITYKDGAVTEDSTTVSRLFGEDVLPAGALYVAAYQKSTDSRFVVPYDVQQ